MIDKPRGFSTSLPALGTETVGVIHENLGIVLTYGFSRQALDEYRGWAARERWDVSDRVLLELPRERATRALIELAVMFRALNDAWKITETDYVKTHPYVVYHSAGDVYGKVYGLDGTTKSLDLRDVPNKVIHATNIDWNFSNHWEPLIICRAAEADHARFRWTHAEVFVNAFVAVCAALPYYPHA
jgi:hypothetical protein